LKELVGQLRTNENQMLTKLRECFRDSMELNEIKNSQKAAQLGSMIQDERNPSEIVMRSIP
jgi:hypothetical protein